MNSEECKKTEEKGQKWWKESYRKQRNGKGNETKTGKKTQNIKGQSLGKAITTNTRQQHVTNDAAPPWNSHLKICPIVLTGNCTVPFRSHQRKSENAATPAMRCIGHTFCQRQRGSVCVVGRRKKPGHLINQTQNFVTWDKYAKRTTQSGQTAGAILVDESALQ